MPILNTVIELALLSSHPSLISLFILGSGERFSDSDTQDFFLLMPHLASIRFQPSISNSLSRYCSGIG